MPIINGYHNGRTSTNPTRRGAKFWYVSNGRLKAVSADRCGGRLYLGVELEVAEFPTETKRQAALTKVYELLGQYINVCSDASLSMGFEIVFDPITLGAFQLIRPLVEQAMQAIADNGGKGHDTHRCEAGLHVHVSRIAFGTTQDARDLALGKVFELTERLQSSFSAIARRDIAYCTWCAPTGYGHKVTDSSRQVRAKSRRVQDGQGYDCHDGGRYHVWNCQNTTTIECRAFRSTLKASTFYATLAFVDSLVRFCTLKTTPEVHAVNTMTELVCWARDVAVTESTREPINDLVNYWADRVNHYNEYTAYNA